MLVDERRNRLLELVRVRRFVSLPELARTMSVSESTIRRDLEQLEDQGSAKRIHGGVLYSGRSPGLKHFESPGPGKWNQKLAIAQRTVELIEDGDTVLLDGGSTTYEIARLLAGRSLHVVTTSLPVANLFAADPAVDLVMIGGNICPRTGVAQGPYADKMIKSLRVRKVILSVAGVDDEGFFNKNLLLVGTERAMMSVADEVIVVADSSKFGFQSLAHLCDLGDVQNLVVDDGISQDWQNKMVASGVNLLIADATDNG